MPNINIDDRIENVCDIEIITVNPNKDEIIATSECIADCFTGVTVNGVLKFEPMNFALQVKKEVSRDFFINFLETMGKDGVCFAAKDIKTGIVVGAIVGEIYDPNIKSIKYTGIFEPYNHIFGFLDELDFMFNSYIEESTGERITKGQYLHVYAIAIKVKGKNISIFDELLRRAEAWARSNSLKGVIAEATNPKSQIKFINKNGYFNPIDMSGHSISMFYKESPAFRGIDPDIAVDCKLVYKKLV